MKNQTYEEFYLKYRKISKAYAYGILHDWNMADDVSQDVLYKMYNMRKGLNVDNEKMMYSLIRRSSVNKTSVYKGYKQDKIEMRGDRAEMSDFPLYLNTVAGGLDRRDQTIGGFSFVVKIYAVPVVEIIR